MARSLHFNASWLYQESAGIGTSPGSGTGSPAAAVAPFKPATPEPLPHGGASPAAADAANAAAVSDVAVRAEQAVVIELLQIARTVLTLEITFEAGPRRTAEVPVPAGAALLDRPVVLRDGQVYGT
ncbi:MAG TPA: hypothetical protein VMR43_09490, partial [Variovorax sp.]|nr:hypothetical protein [Variovorax sp.]